MCIKNTEEVFFWWHGISHSGILKCKTWTKQNQQFIKCCTRHSEISKKTFVDVPSGLRTGSRFSLK